MFRSIAFLIVLFSVAARAELPSLPTDTEKISFLLHLREVFPGLFEDAAKHETDLLQLLDEQQTMEKKLADDPEYRQNLARRGKPLRLKIEPLGEKAVEGRKIDPAAIAEFRQALLGVVRALPDGVPLEQALRKEIEAGAGATVSDLLGKLVAQVPRDKLPTGGIPKVLEMSPAEQNLFLLEHLPETLVANALRLPPPAPKTITRLNAIERLADRRANELRSAHLAEAYLYLKHADAPIAHDKRSAIRKIEDLGEADLDIFQDRAIYDARLKHLDKLGRAVNPAIQAHLKKISDRTVKVAYEAKSGVELIEVPPYLATMRGCPGGDCSSSSHPLTVNSPFERVFLIRGEKGIKGYVQATMGEVAGKKTLYVSCIQGWRVSPGEADLILRGLHESAKMLGVEQIATVRPEQLASSVNNRSLHGVFEEAAKRGMRVPLTIADAKFRKEKIPQGSGYDSPDRHREAILYRPPTDGGPAPRTSTAEATMPEFKLTPPSQADLVLFALDLASVNAHHNVRRILPLAKITQAALEELQGVLGNRKRLGVREYFAEAKKALAPHGIADAERLKHTREYLFRDGVLASAEASDAKRFASLGEADRALVVEYLTDVLESRPNDTRGVEVLKANRDYLMEDRAFLRFLRGFAEEDFSTARTMIAELRRAGVEGPRLVGAIAPMLDHAFDKVEALKQGRSSAVDVLLDNLDLLTSKQVKTLEQKLAPTPADFVAALSASERPEAADAMRLYGAMTRHPEIGRDIPRAVHDAAEKTLIHAAREYGNSIPLSSMLWQWLDTRAVPPAVIDALVGWTTYEMSFEAPWESGEKRDIALKALGKAARHQQLPEGAIAALRRAVDDDYHPAREAATEALKNVGAVSRPSCADAWRAVRQGN